MPVDKQARDDFKRENRRAAAKYIGLADEDERKGRVLSASGRGSGEEERLVSAATGRRSIGLSEAQERERNPFVGTRTAEQLSDVLSDAEVRAIIERGGSESDVASAMRDRLIRRSAGNKSRGDFLNDVFDRYDKSTGGGPQ